MIRFIIMLLVIMLSDGCSISEKGKHSNKERDESWASLKLHTPSLDEIVQENSALLLFRDKVWTINDSGGEAVLFALDIQTGKALQAIYIEGSQNRDWEELTQDADHIYICDTGNNYGRRTNLEIYRIRKSDIPRPLL